MPHYSRLHQVRKVHSAKELRLVHQAMLDSIDRLKTCEAEVIARLQEVERLLVYRHLGYGSMFRYAVEALELSEHQAYAFISVARKARELPVLQEALRNGELTVSKSARIASLITFDNQAEWVEMAKSKTKREIEKAVASASPRAAMPERARFISAGLCHLQFPLAEENLAKIERAREVLGQSRGKRLTLEETLVALAEFFLSRKDPVQKAERVLAKKAAHVDKSKTGLKPELKPELKPGLKVQVEPRLVKESGPAGDATKSSEPNSKKLGPGRVTETGAVPSAHESKATSPPHARSNATRLPWANRHQVMLRDRGRCQARMPDGATCGERLWLEIHHIKSRAEGGGHQVENLTTLCRHHHQLRHLQANGG